MAAGGVSYSVRLMTSAEPEEAVRRIADGLDGSLGVRMRAPEPGTLIIERSYRPGWALTLGLITGVLFLVGALFLIVRRQETLTVTAVADGAGSKVTVSGMSTEDAVGRISRTVLALPDVQMVGVPSRTGR